MYVCCTGRADAAQSAVSELISFCSAILLLKLFSLKVLIVVHRYVWSSRRLAPLTNRLMETKKQ